MALALTAGAACRGGPPKAAPPAEAEATEPVAATGATTSTMVEGPSVTTTKPRPRATTPDSSDRRPQALTGASRLRLDGIGAVQIGMSLAEASEATGMNVRVTSEDWGTDCRYAEAEGGPAGLAFMMVGDRIVRIDVINGRGPSTIATLSGISIGSTEAEVLATYPGRIEVRPNAYSDTWHDLVYRSSDPAQGLIFVTDGHRVDSFRSGQAGHVAAIEGCL